MKFKKSTALLGLLLGALLLSNVTAFADTHENHDCTEHEVTTETNSEEVYFNASDAFTRDENGNVYFGKQIPSRERGTEYFNGTYTPYSLSSREIYLGRGYTGVTSYWYGNLIGAYSGAVGKLKAYDTSGRLIASVELTEATKGRLNIGPFKYFDLYLSGYGDITGLHHCGNASRGPICGTVCSSYK